MLKPFELYLFFKPFFIFLSAIDLPHLSRLSPLSLTLPQLSSSWLLCSKRQTICHYFFSFAPSSLTQPALHLSYERCTMITAHDALSDLVLIFHYVQCDDDIFPFFPFLFQLPSSFGSYYPHLSTNVNSRLSRS